jgi:hypothetical protein
MAEERQRERTEKYSKFDNLNRVGEGLHILDQYHEIIFLHLHPNQRRGLRIMRFLMFLKNCRNRPRYNALWRTYLTRQTRQMLKKIQYLTVVLNHTKLPYPVKKVPEKKD